MGESTAKLREHMLREAIVEVLRGLPDPSREGASVVETGLLRHVAIDGEWARVELEATPSAAHLVHEVQRRVESLPEVVGAEVLVGGDDHVIQ